MQSVKTSIKTSNQPIANQLKGNIMSRNVNSFIDIVGAKPVVGLTFWVGNNLRKVTKVDELVHHDLVSEEQDFLA